ncbi:molybdopterin molybdenumtransferase MoeA, partial [Enterococcus hirae]
EAMPTFPAESVETVHAAGRVLQHQVVAARDPPPFDRVMMDGIAIAYADFRDGTRAFPVQGQQMAGEPARQLERGHCL